MKEKCFYCEDDGEECFYCDTKYCGKHYLDRLEFGQCPRCLQEDENNES